MSEAKPKPIPVVLNRRAPLAGKAKFEAEQQSEQQRAVKTIAGGGGLALVFQTFDPKIPTHRIVNEAEKLVRQNERQMLREHRKALRKVGPHPRSPTHLPAKHALGIESAGVYGWLHLNLVIAESTEEALLDLLVRELTTAARRNYVYRIHARLNVIRTRRERAELAEIINHMRGRDYNVKRRTYGPSVRYAAEE